MTARKLRGLFASPEAGPFLFGHRGFSSIAPENTLPAFQALLEHGIPGVELDVQLCESGELVVIHDESLERTTGSPALVRKMPYSKIRELDGGSWFSASFSGTRVPLLDEVFDLLGRRLYYDIELKWGSRKTGELEKRLLERLRTFGLEDRCLVSSFNPYCLRTIRRLDDSIPLALIYAACPEVPSLLRRGEGWVICRPDIVKPHYRQVTTLSLSIYRKLLGNRVFAWTVDEPQEARRLIQSGVRGIVTNRPDRIKPVIEAG